MKILGLCGSLRGNSSNSFILNAAKNELNSHTWLDFNIAELPFFDPDQQFSDSLPQKVKEVRYLAEQVDFIFVSTPEYAHGIPGILKNAFEWIFHEGTIKKPVFVVIGSAQGENTKNQLIEILTTMDFVIKEDQILLIKSARTKINSTGQFLDQSTENEFRKFCALILKT